MLDAATAAERRAAAGRLTDADWERIAEGVKLSPAELEATAYLELERMVGAAVGAHARDRANAGPSLEEAYTILGVSPEAPEAEVKRAYRRLMSRHHPDKLAARGLPEEMMRTATEKTQQIKAAWDRVQSARARKGGSEPRAAA